MHLHAAGRQKIRKYRIEKAEEEGYRGAQGYQGVHVGSPVAGLLDGVDEETAAAVKDRQGHHQHDPVRMGVVHEDHRYHHQGNGQHPGRYRTEAQSAVAFPLFFFFFFLRIVAAYQDIVPDGAYLCLYIGKAHHRSIVGDAHIPGSEIHVRRQYTRDRACLALHVVGAHGTVHFQHRDDRFLYIVLSHIAKQSPGFRPGLIM